MGSRLWAERREGPCAAPLVKELDREPVRLAVFIDR